jgi:hypothetical protein
MTQSVSYYVSFSRMVVDSNIIIFGQLYPSALYQIQIVLREYVLGTLVIVVYDNDLE